ncbi:MAG: fimbria major subunit [Muribaculaceae bacterium]|nr:fimbria major subunit [Muribaculaceae bacterium]
METGSKDASEYDDYWCKGYAENLKNLLSGEPFTYNGTTHDNLSGNSKDDPILYYKDGRLYMGWKNMRQAAIQESVTMDVSGKLEINDGTALYQAVFGEGPIPPGQKYLYEKDGELKDIEIVDPRWKDTYKPDGSTNTNDADYQNYLKSPNYLWTKWSEDGKNESIDEDGNVNKALADMRAAVTAAGTTIYQSSLDKDIVSEKYPDGTPGYYCYYYYWNRHNDNGMNGSMGPMEFDVVRNNVYKLSVDEIKRLGHPRIPSNDPNDPDPGTKDESEDIYLDVKVQILPWVVRLNSIKF